MCIRDRCRDYLVSVYQELIEQETGKPLAELGWRTRLKDPDAMAKLSRERVIAAFERLCTDKHLLPTQGNSEIPSPGAGIILSLIHI